MKNRNIKKIPCKNLVIAFYQHPEYYPPTLNAVECLAVMYDTVYLVHRNIAGFDWKYPGNVKLIAPQKLLGAKQAEQAGLPRKILWFLHFTWLFFSIAKKKNTDTVLIYDTMPVLSFRLLYVFIKSPRILWYHNHDVNDLNYVRKWSLGWWAWKSEKWIFPKLNLFTLPALERRKSFPMSALKGAFFFIPNFPSVKTYEPYQAVKKIENSIRLLYQGSIGPQHGLEEIISLLNKKIQEKELYLVLKGFISGEYLQQLQALAEQYGVIDKLIYKGPGGYRGVMENAATCHIGIGIHKKNDIMNKTLGTASNKIYEYAAMGLPVLLYDNMHFRTHLEKYEWAFFTNCTAASLTDCLETIITNYDCISAQARKDFNVSLNFEHYFTPVTESLNII